MREGAQQFEQRQYNARGPSRRPRGVRCERARSSSSSGSTTPAPASAAGPIAIAIEPVVAAEAGGAFAHAPELGSGRLDALAAGLEEDAAGRLDVVVLDLAGQQRLALADLARA